MTQLDRKQFLRTTGVAAMTAAGGLALRGATGAQAVGAAATAVGRVNDQGGQVFNVTNPAYGAKADTVRSGRGGAVAAGVTSFSQAALVDDTSSHAVIEFAAADVGKVLTIQGAGPSGGVLATTITAVISATTVTLADAAAASVSDAAFAYGTDDTAAIVAAITTAGLTGTVYLPAGIYTIRGASNAGKPILHTGRGGIRGRGGKSPGGDVQRGPNTVLLCSDASAGLIANGCARYESFCCDGNNIATQPLQNGVVAGGVVTAPSTHATFIDVWAAGSAANGWEIFGARGNGYYDCGTRDNALDGLVIDGGTTGLTFVHFRQRGDLRYGIRGDHAVASASGSVAPTSAVRFYSAVLGDRSGRPPGLSTVHLRNATDWRFPHTTILGEGLLGPTVDLDQSLGHSIDLSDCTISSSQDTTTAVLGRKPKKRRPATATTPTRYACIQISGTPTDTAAHTFLKVDGCQLLDGDHSIAVDGDPGPYRYSAADGWRDTTRHGPVVAAGVPAFDTLFDGRTGSWQTAAAVAPWSGTVSYRVMAERWVEMRGTVQRSGTGTGPIFTLPLGYRPIGSTRRTPAIGTSGLAIAVVSATGDVSAVPIGAGAFPVGTSVHLDGTSYTIGGA